MGLVLTVPAATRYVDVNNSFPAAPYTSWATAATNIQDAVDAAMAQDSVIVTNGVYETGATEYAGSNRVTVTKPIYLESVNGPEVTIIKGYQVEGATNGEEAVRCIYLGSGAVLSGFTLTQGATVPWGTGGGVYCDFGSTALVTNCVLIGNSGGNSAGGAVCATLSHCKLIGNRAGSYGGAANFSTLDHCLVLGNISGAYGGGVHYGTLNNCLIVSNTAAIRGGGASGDEVICELNYCTVVANTAGSGAGTAYATVRNSIISGNIATGENSGTEDNEGSHLAYCCTPTEVPDGVGNLTNAPLFVDAANGNFRLQSNSPCLNAGETAAVTFASDFDGLPRISGGSVDLGAYEFQSPPSRLSYAWAQRYGIPTDGSGDFLDADGDGMNNWGEFKADTIPTNAASVLKMQVLISVGKFGRFLTVFWDSVPGRKYWLERANFSDGMMTFETVATDINSAGDTTWRDDPVPASGGPYFYRVGVY